MLKNTLTNNSAQKFAKRATPVAMLAASLALVGCSNVAEADATTDGQLAYACTLTDHVLEEHGTPDSWDAFIGDDVNPGAREASAIGFLTNGSENDAFVETGASLIEAMQRIDIESLTSDLHDIHAACEDAGVSSGGDVSPAGQLNYACTLAGRFTEEHGAAAEWVGDHQQGAWDEVAELVSAAALVGAANGQTLAEYSELSEAGLALLTTLQRQDPDGIDDSLEAFEAACAAL